MTLFVLASLDGILKFLLLSCYDPTAASQIVLSEEEKKDIEDKILKDFYSLSETELALAYTALTTIFRHKNTALKKKMEEVYGFRL